MPGEPIDDFGDPREPEESTGTQSSEESLRAEFKAYFAEHTKGLQRVISNKDREIQSFRQTLEEREAAAAGQTEALSYLQEMVVKLLPDEDRAEMEADLQRKLAARNARELAELRREVKNPSRAQVQAPDPGELEEYLAQIKAQAQEALEEVAKEHGMDPRDKTLVYGEDSDNFPARLKKLNASIRVAKKAQLEAETAGVRQKSPIPNTRIDGGSVSSHTGKSTVDDAFDELYERMQKQGRARTR